MKPKSAPWSGAELRRLLAGALRELAPGARVAAALPRLLRSERARVVAIGKAAPAMAASAITCWGAALEACLVVAPDATDTRDVERAAARAGIADRLVIVRASHPLPDARSVRAGRSCLETVRTAEPRRIVVLVSGGASALACVPCPGVTLRTKRAITQAMLASGASIQEINVVRKHLSRLKGGGLALAAGPNRVDTVVASDVIGGTASDVGSGPSVSDGTTVSDARRLLRRFAPSFAAVPLVKTLAASDADAVRLRDRVVISPEDLATTFARLAGERTGAEVRVLPPSQASVEELGAAYAALAQRAVRQVRRAGGVRVYVRAAEPSVRVAPAKDGGRPGRGGRATHLAALVGRALGDRHGPQRVPEVRERSRGEEAPRVIFAAFASDGVDGASGTAGAVIDGRFAERVAKRLGPQALAEALAAFDTGRLHRAMRTAVASAPTGHNLADLHVLVVAGRARR